MLIEELIPNTKKVNQFHKKGIETVDDLLEFAPRLYYDFSKISNPFTLHDGDMAVIYGKIETASNLTSKNGKNYLNFTIKDIHGHIVTLLIFNASFWGNRLSEGKYVTLCGKVAVRVRDITMVNPLLIIEATANDPCLPNIYPVYSKIAGMSDDYLNDAITKAMETMTNTDYLPSKLREQLHFFEKREAVKRLHHPNSMADVKYAKRRLAFDRLMVYNRMLLHQKADIDTSATWRFDAHAQLPLKYISQLPYELTEDQKKAINSIVKNGIEGVNEKLLVVGDVGYGKTEVAKVVSLYTVDQKKQCIIMAPTQILSEQHYMDFKKSYEDLGLNVALLNASLKKRERKALLKQIKDGDVDIVIGTHSLISDEIEFHDLGMMIIDEEHRFGVELREKIALKYPSIYSISMSATPIPRTLAIGLYGLTTRILTIKTAPKNRKPVNTFIAKDGQEFKAVAEELRKGHQIYVVCPAIDDNEETSLSSVEAVYEQYRHAFPSIKIGKMNGKMKADEKTAALESFQNNDTKILIATTMIEVGVNVPNATLMIIKDANHFGLAQLHQLRGRVGRSNTITENARCFLLVNAESVPQRLNVIANSNDGFVIAEADMKERGSGNWLGNVQSGHNDIVDLMIEYSAMNDFIVNKIILPSINDPRYKALVESAY